MFKCFEVLMTSPNKSLNLVNNDCPQMRPMMFCANSETFDRNSNVVIEKVGLFISLIEFSNREISLFYFGLFFSFSFAVEAQKKGNKKTSKSRKSASYCNSCGRFSSDLFGATLCGFDS